MEDVNKHILVRGLGLSALGKLDNETVKIAARFDIPHHEGAGGIEDFADKIISKTCQKSKQQEKEKEKIINHHYSTKRVKKITSAT